MRKAPCIVHIPIFFSLTRNSVKGDGATDDSASLNAILADNAAKGKVSYFPYGVYIVKSTLHIPPGSRIVGEAWPVISGMSVRAFIRIDLITSQVLVATLAIVTILKR